MKLLRRLIAALLLTSAVSPAFGSDWYVWDDGMGHTLWCQASTGICIELDSVPPIDP